MRRQAEMTSSAAKMNTEMISWDYFTFAEMREKGIIGERQFQERLICDNFTEALMT